MQKNLRQHLEIVCKSRISAGNLVAQLARRDIWLEKRYSIYTCIMLKV